MLRLPCDWLVRGRVLGLARSTEVPVHNFERVLWSEGPEFHSTCDGLREAPKRFKLLGGHMDQTTSPKNASKPNRQCYWSQGSAFGSVPLPPECEKASILQGPKAFKVGPAQGSLGLWSRERSGASGRRPPSPPSPKILLRSISLLVVPPFGVLVPHPPPPSAASPSLFLLSPFGERSAVV